MFSTYKMLPEYVYLVHCMNVNTLKKIATYAHVLYFLPALLKGQDSTSITWSAYVEAYYCYDLDKPNNHKRPDFLYNHKRHNEVNVNLAFLKGTYSAKRSRVNLALMSGTYAQYNLAYEPVVLRHIYEASAGVKISEGRNIWIDAGIMPSHIGFESAVASDCWSLSRCMVAENSPYYESGVRLSATSSNSKLYGSLLFLNGWQRISRLPGYNTPNLGMQLTWKPRSSLTLNYSNFSGSDKPDSLHALRTYHNFYLIYEPDIKWGVTAGFDIGRDKNTNNQYANWYSPLLIVKRGLSTKSRLVGRVEYFSDREEVIITTGSPHGFQTLGSSINYDYSLNQHVMFRVEYKWYHSEDKLFGEGKSYNNHSFLGSLICRF